MRRGILAMSAALLLLLTACGGRTVSQVGAWTLESAADGRGTPLLSVTDVTCTVEADGTLTLTGDLEGSGTYTAQIVDDRAVRLEVALEDGTAFTGTCGLRTYSDGTSTPTLLLGSADYILSFLPA